MDIFLIYWKSQDEVELARDEGDDTRKWSDAELTAPSNPNMVVVGLLATRLDEVLQRAKENAKTMYTEDEAMALEFDDAEGAEEAKKELALVENSAWSLDSEFEDEWVHVLRDCGDEKRAIVVIRKVQPD